jgi:cytochrome b
MAGTHISDRKVRVWDLSTRLFHWSLLALVLLAWFTGEEEGAGVEIHRYAGEAIAGLIVFRVIWGFVGGEHARFSDFAAGPTKVAAHVRDLFSARPSRHLGHNPLGAVAVFLLLLTVSAVVVTGLFSGGEHNAGPFAGAWGLELSELHEALFRMLQALVIVHLLGVVAETLRTKDALVPAMITGSKRRRQGEAGEHARPARVVSLLVALAAAAGVAGALMTQPAAPTQSSNAENEAGEYEAEFGGNDER